MKCAMIEKFILLLLVSGLNPWSLLRKQPWIPIPENQYIPKPPQDAEFSWN